VLSARTRRSANRVRQALKLAAMSLSRNDSALGAFYRRLCARMDKPRANTAVAHKLSRMVYFMLTRGEAFVNQGQQHYEEQQRQRSIRGAQTPRVRAWFPDHSRHENGLKTTRTSMRCFSRAVIEMVLGPAAELGRSLPLRDGHAVRPNCPSGVC
jgi:hypothetical protein